MKVILFLQMLCFSLNIYAQEGLKNTTMNGHQLKDFKDFEKKWKLVTVRFRKDTEEMRFTYANALAYQALLKGRIDYPDGAVFAKIGYKTEEDTSFPSSAVPSGARRFQFMVRNKKKYAESSGWSYALFDDKGKVFPEDLKTQTLACVACHNAVPERGYVFSELMKKRSTNKPSSLSHLIFKTVEKSQLPKSIIDLLPLEVTSVRVLEGEMAKDLFQGTLEEIRPALSKEVASSKMAAVLYNKDGSRFSLVLPENIGTSCTNESKTGIFMKSIFSTLNAAGTNGEKILHFCYSL